MGQHQARDPQVQVLRGTASAGLSTACAEACPTGATKFGDRDELLEEAARRIAAEPGKYVPAIYGKDDIGGTSMLYISPVPFAALGFDPRLKDAPMPVLTMNALEKAPTVLTVGGVMLAGIWWITNRREAVRAHETAARKDRDSSKGDDACER